MNIFLLDVNKNMTNAWLNWFGFAKTNTNVAVVNDYFENFMNEHPNMEAIVSPANSFGLMDGGYDKAITDYFGSQLMKDVQERIIDDWYGEQPVGTSMSVSIKNRYVPKGLNYKLAILIHTPTMRTPEQIIDGRIIYQCMRTTLIEAIKQEANSIVIPAFGGLTGKVPCDIVAKMMFLAYEQVFNPPQKLNWDYALYISNKF